MSDWKSMAVALAGLVLIFCLAGCAGPAGLSPLAKGPGGAEQEFDACRAVFKQQPFSAVHRIEGNFRGQSVALIGAIKADPVSRRIESVLMSPEGAVLFDGAVSGKEITTNKALPPFDSKPFARALLGDVELMLLPPFGLPMETGLAGAGQRACRWRRSDGNIIEVSLTADGGWRTRLYDEKEKLIRELESKPPIKNGLASEITLKAHGGADYRLKATLIEE